MSNVSRNLKDLNEGSSQAIQALLNSIAPGSGTKADAVKKLTEKLGELVGEDAMKEFNQGRNERGELVNEEGLPIIEITEPLTSAAERGIGNSLLAEEEQLIQIESLPPPVRERWKEERDRILDLLEEEEREEQRKEDQDDVEVREAILQKRREAAIKEKEKMKTAKEMQKKMGKALLRDMAETRSKEENVFPAPDKTKNTKDSSKKTVSFAVESEDEELPSDALTISKPALDWGDVTPARLKNTSTRPLLRTSETLPMKMNVVEREPKNQPKINTPTNADSDDESDLEATEDNEDGNNSAFGPRIDEPDPARSPVESESEEELTLEEDEYDIDFAQHQREIALQYYEKRSSIGGEALAAMTSHSHYADGDVRVDIPLDMPSSEPHSKPSISQFRANRIASAYSASAPSSPSVSLGASVLPAATVRTIQKAVKTGKVDADGRLVGGDLDSASEDEVDGMQDVLELLKKGEVYNLGPDGKYIHTIPPRNADGEAEAPSRTPLPSSSLGTNPLPVLNKPKISRFKLDRSQAGRPALHASSPSTTPDSKSETHGTDVRRLAPKMPVSSVIERHSLTKDTSATSPSSRMSSTPLSPSTSFSIPGNTASGKSRAGPVTMPSMIVESPSFAKPQPPMPSMVVESPSFARPANRQPPTIISSPSFSSPVSNQSTSRPVRPPTVLSSSVLEASKAPAANKTTTPEPGKKISRFMADRM